MAWKEPNGKHSWRVRYHHNGNAGTVPERFATEQDTLNYIADMEPAIRPALWLCQR